MHLDEIYMRFRRGFGKNTPSINILYIDMHDAEALQEVSGGDLEQIQFLLATVRSKRAVPRLGS